MSVVDPGGDHAPTLKRNLSLWDGIIFVVSLVIGSGIFLKPQAVLANSGSPGASILVWVIGGLITICCGLTIAEVASHIPRLGGLFTYLTELYGRVVGFLYGWVEAVIASPGACGAMAIAVATFASFFMPMSGSQQKVFAVLLIVTIVVVNAIATRAGVWLQNIATVLKLIPIAAIILWGLIRGDLGQMNFENVGGAEHSFGVAMLGVLWAYDGWINACTLGDEIDQPERNLPLAIITGITFVIIVSVLFNLAVFASVPLAQVATSPAVGNDVALALFGSWGGAFITAGMMISVFGALNSQMMSGARISLAVGQRRELPGGKILGAIHPRLKTPLNSLVFEGLISIAFVLVGTFNVLTDLVIFVIWIFFTLGVFGVFILRRRVEYNPQLYHVPLFPLVPILGLIGGAYLMVATILDSLTGALTGIGLTVLGLPFYYWAQRDHHHSPSARPGGGESRSAG